MTRELAQAVLDAFSACPEFKEAAQAYLDAIGTKKEAAAAADLIAEAKADIIPIERAIAFLESDKATQIFGEAVAAEKLTEVAAAKEAGAVYCNCPGCRAAKAIIDAT